MLHELRFLHIDIGERRRDYPIPAHFHGLHRIGYFLIFLLFRGELPHERNQLIFVINGHTCHPADIFVIIFIIHLHAEGPNPI